MKPNPVSLVPTELACSHMFHVLGEALTLLLPPNPNPQASYKAEAQHVVGTNAEDGWVDAMPRFVLDRL